MKKIICFLLNAVMFLQLASCSKSENLPIERAVTAVAGPVEITIGTIGISNFENLAYRFNQKNGSQIKVKLVDYLTDGHSRQEAITRLNLDLLSGKGPDIIDFEKFPSRGLYAKQGLLLDMSECFSSELNKDDYYLLNMLNDANMYFFASSFGVFTCYGLANVFSGMDRWSFEQYSQMNGMPQFTQAYPEGRQQFIETICYGAFSNWIDWDSNICDFKKSDFKSLLIFASSLSKEGGSLNMCFPSEVGNGSMLYDHAYIQTPISVKDLEKSVGAPVSFVGYPTFDGSNGSFIYPSGILGVNASTPHPDEVWDFIKYIISDDEIQQNQAWTLVPVMKSANRYLTDNLLNPYAKYEGQEIVVYDDGSFSVDGVYMDAIYDPSPQITQEQVDKFYDLIDNAEKIYEYDPGIYSIILSSTDKYFNGAQTLEATINDIQARVSIYLAEQHN